MKVIVWIKFGNSLVDFKSNIGALCCSLRVLLDYFYGESQVSGL